MQKIEHSICGSASTSYDEKGHSLIPQPTGSHKVTYRADSHWDFYLDVAKKPIDLSLILPHYRARYQPIDYRMNMFVGTESGPVKLKLCRTVSRSKFYLEVQGSMSDVTIWLPSDFKGVIQHSSKAKFSAGFINRIMENVRFNRASSAGFDEDCVVVVTHGQVNFRMWDAQTCAPESVRKETLKRMFGCTRKAPETIDWDFLLED